MKNVVFVVGVLIFVAVVFLWQKADQKKMELESAKYSVLVEKKLAQARETAGKIHPGMKRREVEQLFKIRNSGRTRPGYTEYYEHPQVLIEIPYIRAYPYNPDTDSGKWHHEEDTVSEQPIYVLRSHPAAD